MSIVIAALVAAITLSTGPVTSLTGPVVAAQGAASAGATTPTASTGLVESATWSSDEFDPGYIVSDDAFYNDAAMTEEGIREFLGARSCKPRDDVPCLSRYRQSTPTVPADPGHCERYEGARRELASRIISKVAKACRISPRVLLVLMQKEQSLITRPSARGYERATGYGCPDTADCATEYFGLFNQLYNAAWQFREYTLNPTSWRHAPGKVEVAFNPRAECGSRVVRIANQATANLYNYTPYQPTRAALHGTERADDTCSSYGNLNFSKLYTQWFGDPRTVRFGEPWARCLASPGGRLCPDNVWRSVSMPAREYPAE